MKLFKIFALTIFTLSLKGSFACSFEVDKYVLSSEKRIKESIEQVLSSENFKKAPDLCLFLEKEISETMLALEENLAEDGKKDFTDFVLKNVINNQSLNSYFLNFAILNTEPVSIELSAWQNRALEKFLNIYKNNGSLISNEDKELFKKTDLVKKEFLYLKGKDIASDKMNDFTILNYNYLALNDFEKKSFAKEVLAKNPDVICLEGVFLKEDAELLYDQLKKNYEHFYVDIDSDSINLNSGLFVASKFAIAQPQAHFFNGFSCFEFFVLNNQNELMGLVYLFDLQLMNKGSSDIEKFLKGLNNENLMDLIPVLICGNFRENKGSQIKISTFTWLLQDYLFMDQNMVKFTNEQFRLNGNDGIFSMVKNDSIKERKLLKKFEGIRSYNEIFANENNMNYKMKREGLNTVWCHLRDDEGFHGHVSAYVEGDSDNDGHARVEVEEHYTYKTDSGVSVSASVSAEAKVDNTGNAEAKGSVGLTGEWK